MKLHTSTHRVFKIIEALATYPFTTIDQLVEDTHIPYTTVYRILQACIRLEYVEFVSSHEYRLSQKLFHITSTYLHEHCTLSVIARSSLQKLYYYIKETIHLGILEDNNVLYVDKIETEHKIRMHSYIGYRAEVYCTALGKSILSYLDTEARDNVLKHIKFTKYTPSTITSKEKLIDELNTAHTQGYAEDEEENETHLYCIAVPVFDRHGNVLGAVSISFLLFRFNPQKKDSIIQKLWECGESISRQLGNKDYYRCLKGTTTLNN